MRKVDVYLKHRLSTLKDKFPNLLKVPFLSDHAVQIILFFSLVLILAAWIVSFLRFQPSEFELPLRYDSFLGVTKLGKWYDLYRLPMIGTLSFAVNYFLGNLTYSKDKMLGYIFAGATFFVSLMTLVVVINFGILVK